MRDTVFTCILDEPPLLSVQFSKKIFLLNVLASFVTVRHLSDGKL